ncbi:MAG: hypothetical protein MK209_07445 [Planctomycetes bacterium]|nr:hypothetical protein [Planctomycetota bacterium]
MLLMLHNPIEGIGSFYGGILHPLVVPEQALLLVTTSAFLAQQGLPALRRAIPVGLVLLGAAVFAQPLCAWAPPQSLALVLGALLGLSVAAQLRLPLVFPVVIAGLFGLVIGLSTDLQEIPVREEGLFQSGALLGGGLGLLCLAVWLESAELLWQEVVIRVLGSWAAASSLIVLMWQRV